KTPWREPMKLTDLLDQIDRLDQQATKGSWITGANDETGLKYLGTGYCDCCTPPIPSAGVILGETGRAEAEFIALARTALPQLAAVIRRLRECAQTLTEDNNDASDYASGIHEAVECFEHIITDALGADDD